MVLQNTKTFVLPANDLTLQSVSVSINQSVRFISGTSAHIHSTKKENMHKPVGDMVRSLAAEKVLIFVQKGT